MPQVCAAVFFVSVMIFFLPDLQENCRNAYRQKLSRHDGEPDAVHLPDQGEEENADRLKYKRPQEGDGGGGWSVI